MTKNDLKIVFMGTPEFAVETLRALVEGGYNVVAVVTQPDKPVGRHGSVLRAPAVKEYALSVGLPVLQPEKMKDADFIEQLRSYHADLQVVVAFRVLPEIVWAMPRFGTFNVHAALLPQYRGAAPINWAIINGETETGVTTFFLDHDIDTGKIILQKRFPIPDDADVEYVYDGLMHLGAEIALETVDLIIEKNGDVSAIPQEEYQKNNAQLSTLNSQLKLAPKLFKENCRIDWRQAVKNIYNFVRGLSPVPSAWTTLVPLTEAESHSPIDLKIFKTKMTSEACEAEPGTLRTEKNRLFVATADAWLEILDLQQAGKKRMTARDFLNGFKNPTEFCLK
ncbi:MAG: methionyl-tRNA formyltransferase [Prevotella sp.]|nr:methionyl-tRNA formyltransferase [Prevotella sp.]